MSELERALRHDPSRKKSRQRTKKMLQLQLPPLRSAVARPRSRLKRMMTKRLLHLQRRLVLMARARKLPSTLMRASKRLQHLRRLGPRKPQSRKRRTERRKPRPLRLVAGRPQSRKKSQKMAVRLTRRQPSRRRLHRRGASDKTRVATMSTANKLQGPQEGFRVSPASQRPPFLHGVVAAVGGVRVSVLFIV